MKRINGAEIGKRDMKTSSVSIFPTTEELDVAQILHDFSRSFEPTLWLFDYLPDDSNWKRKKRRSCLDPIPPLPPIQYEIKAPSTAAKGGGDHRTSTSPETPFLFPLADEKLNRSAQKTSRKRKKYSDEIAQLTQQKCFLETEIENVKNYCSKLKAYNSQLKSMKQEVAGGMKKKVEIGLTHHPPPPPPPPPVQAIQFPIGPIRAHSQPPAQEIQFPIGPIRAHSHSQPSDKGSGFDLNFPPFGVDELQPLDMNRLNDDRRVRYAEARRMRKGLMKKKSIK